jgi:hypothetical protein
MMAEIKVSNVDTSKVPDELARVLSRSSSGGRRPP